MGNFLRGHVTAFNAWNCVPRVLLFDNLKSAVLERRGDAIRFNPILLEFAAHYRFEPRPVAVARGNEKGAWREPYVMCAIIFLSRARLKEATEEAIKRKNDRDQRKKQAKTAHRNKESAL